jgi:hypothetical protein
LGFYSLPGVGHWNRDVIGWLALMPTRLLEKAWLSVRYAVAPWRLATLAWFKCSLERRMVALPRGRRFLGKICIGPDYNPKPVALRVYRELAWKATGAVRGKTPTGAFLNRESGKPRVVSNAAGVVAVFWAEIAELAWRLVGPAPGTSEGVRRARTWRVLVAAEGANCVPALAMELGAAFVELHPCDQG